MGILNITPDSFYEHSRLLDEKSVLLKAEQMIKEGASILDVGGYSSRPGAIDISDEEEQERVLPVIKVLAKNFPDQIISIDTFRAEVARRAIEHGALMINDISAGQLDKNMFSVVAQAGLPYIMMHMRGTPQNMVQMNSYENLINEVAIYFAERLSQLREMGVKDVIVDPGFGFAKNIEQNFSLLKHLAYFKTCACPVLVGLSRKSMIYKTLGISATEALNGSTALHMLALMNGASILRVHDVKEAVETIKLYLQVAHA